MFFLIDKEMKLMIGWSYKCGCSHIKYIFKCLVNKKSSFDLEQLHIDIDDKNKLPIDYLDYKIMIIVRNPYDRLVSGFIDIYNKRGSAIINIDQLIYLNELKHKNNNRFTFTLFINEMYKNGFDNINYHFNPQFGDSWEKGKIEKHPNVIFNDLYTIDYQFLENIYDIPITPDMRQFKGNHIIDKKQPSFNKLYDLVYSKYSNESLYTAKFFNQDIINKVNHIYKTDIDYLKNIGMNYNLTY